jgi:hypothetical protein
MIVGTPDSRKLCKQIAERTETVVFGFSRGKDTLAAVPWLQEFFPRVILFHVDGCPGLSFVERSLKYYEDWFQQPIHRCYSGDLFTSIANLVYQPVEDEDAIDALHLMDQDIGTDRVAELIRDQYADGSAWIAWGISCADSIIRRSQAKYRTGLNEPKRVFYPCFDWRREHVMQSIAATGVQLPEDYKMACRSFATPLNMRHLARMREMYPEDFERVKFFYPFIEASLARNEFRIAALGGNKPSLPVTDTAVIGRTDAKTQAKKSSSGSTSKHAAAESDGTASRMSTKSTTQSETPDGNSRKRRSRKADAQITKGPR